MTNTGSNFIHHYTPATKTGHSPLLLLHGTGGDENDLVPMGQAVAPGAALVSPRGKVLENGMPRFFRRLAEGVFDEDDLRLRAAELAEFIAQARNDYALPAPFALGFSNGANMAAALLLLHPEALAGAVLLRAMKPLQTMPTPDLTGKRILLLAGATDPIIPADNARGLAEHLQNCGAAVEFHTLPVGHGLSQADLRLTSEFLS
ncbi:alpha/beta hydrolase [Aureimonas fodinaquatilis]|uniref:Alpha/beta hydrolase n=1 Tax=Aureimonas fodinaquatilis TaxID=2565783 RepID=A0A5B0DV77_9HYPH|nr:alpha/beta hydrolase [Aureimonas fodinaquatilis]KAA0970634.1 alpha/beta hydrolase [Aureimonas fodinaquatilis]